MSSTEYDVVLAPYLVPDLAQKEFDAIVGLVEGKQLDVEGVVLVTVDPQGEPSIKETGDHLGRKGAEVFGGVGLVVGLFWPPLLASVIGGAVVGGLVGKFAEHRITSGLEEKLGAKLPPGSAIVVAIYDRTKTDLIDKTLASATLKSTAHVDGKGANHLKEALAEAQAGMGG